MKMDKLLQLKQERATLTTNIRALIDEFNDVAIPAEKKSELEKMEGDFDGLNSKIEREEAQLNRERMAGEKQETHSGEKSEDPDVKLREAFGSYLRSADHNTIERYRTLQQDNPTQAGYLVAPEKFVAEVISDLNDIVFMRTNARKFTLDKAQSLGFPKRTTRMSTFAWGTEIQAPTADTSLAFGKREFIPRPATGGILVSKTLVRNSAVNIEQYIRGEFANDFGVGMEQAYLTGDGAGKPLGVFTASADGISTSRDVSTGNTATEMKFDGLIEAKYSIKQQHQTNLRWLFHRDGVKQIVKLKDSNGQYIWQPSVVLGQPDLLLNLPVDMSEHAPNTFTTGLYAGILGNFNYYWIADSLNMEVQALMELYALTNQVYYIARMETDGMPVLEEAFARVKLG